MFMVTINNKYEKKIDRGKYLGLPGPGLQS